MSSGTLSRSLAGGVLAVIWGVCGVGVWVLAAWRGESVVVVVGASLVTGVFSIALIASQWRESVRKAVFSRQIRVPNWLWIGLTAAVLVTPVTVQLEFRPLNSFVWSCVFFVSCSYTVTATVEKSWTSKWAKWPVWITLVALGLLSCGVGVALLDRWSVVDLVVGIAVVLFTCQVGLVLPASLYQAATDPPTESLESYPLVSVIVPAYNEAGVVGECITAILDSTYPNDRLELIVVDDGSRDGTYYEVGTYGDRVARLRRENGGKHAALNLGLCCSSGSVIVTVDADSRPQQTAITRMVRCLETNPSVGALSASVLPVPDRTPLTAMQRIEYVLSSVNRRAFSLVGAVPVVPGCLGVYRRAALADTWGFDPDTITEDFDMTIQLLKNGWEVRQGPGVVRTIVPGSWRALWRQRLRWYHGSVETIYKHREVLLEPRHRYLHTVLMPTRVVSQFFTPLGSYVILGVVVYQFVVSPSADLAALCGVFLSTTLLITVFSLAIENESLKNVVYAPLLFVGYKHFVDLTVGVGAVRAFLGKRRW